MKQRSCWFAVSNFIIVRTKSIDFHSDSGNAFELTISLSSYFYFTVVSYGYFNLC